MTWLAQSESAQRDGLEPSAHPSEAAALVAAEGMQRPVVVWEIEEESA